MVQESEMDDPVAEFAAEAAARRLPLKRQCSARLRARAEPRVYPRPSAITGETIAHVKQFARPFGDLTQVERLLEDGAGVVLEPGAHVVQASQVYRDPRTRIPPCTAAAMLMAAVVA